MLGSRGTFVCNTIFRFGLYYDFGRKKLNLVAVFIFAINWLVFKYCICIFLALEVDKSSLSMYDSVLMLLYDQE